MGLNYNFTTPEEKLPEMLAFVVSSYAPNAKRRQLIERDGLRCYWCNRLCNPMLSQSSDLFPTKDHLVRKADGGTSDLNNLVVACRKCNNSRHGLAWLSRFQPTVINI